MDVVHDDVDVAIVVEVGERGPSPGGRRRDRRPETLGHILEASISKVAINDLPLFVAGLRLDPFDLRIHVAVDDEDVQPAVVVEIDEGDAPSEPAGVEPDSSREGAILAEALAAIRVQRRGVSREVGLEEVDCPVAVVVADGDAHARLRLAVLAVGAAGFDADILEGSVLVVHVQRARVRVVRHVQIDPPVVVEVERADAEAVGAAGARDARSLRDVLELSLAGVAVEDVLAAR